MIEALIPIVAIVSFFGVIALAFYFRYRSRADIQTTVRTAIESGQELSPELIEGLMDSLTNRHSDLRRGVISIAIGAAVFAFASLVGEEEAEGPLMALSMFPVLIGIAYLGLWYFLGRNLTTESPRERPREETETTTGLPPVD